MFLLIQHRIEKLTRLTQREGEKVVVIIEAGTDHMDNLTYNGTKDTLHEIDGPCSLPLTTQNYIKLLAYG